jgi:hypothetical protein
MRGFPKNKTMPSRWKQSKVARELYDQSKNLDFKEMFSLFFALSILVITFWGMIKIIKFILIVW